MHITTVVLLFYWTFVSEHIQLSVRDAELQAAREERDLAVRDKMDAMRIQCARCGDAGSGEAADATSGSGTDEKDASLIPELLRKAWEQRDGAVRRKNAVQVQLARTRVDVLQANGQLMEAIGQKVELSQQLEQWQVRNIFQQIMYIQLAELSSGITLIV